MMNNCKGYMGYIFDELKAFQYQQVDIVIIDK